MRFAHITLLLPFLLLSSCTSLEVMQINPSLLDPETATPEKVNFSLEMGSAEITKITDDASKRPPTMSATTTTSNDIRGGLRYGVNNSFDFAAGLNSKMGIYAQSKLRFIGDNKSEGFLLSGTAFFSADSTTKSGDQNGDFGPGGYPWEAKASSSIYSLGLSAGLRTSNSMLFFTHAGFGKSSTDFTITQTAANSDPGGEYKFEDSANVSHFGIGATFGHSTRFSIGAIYVQKKWDKPNSFEDTDSILASLKLESF